MVNRERPVFVMVNPEDLRRSTQPATRGRPLGEAVALLMGAAPPDEAFADDMRAVLLAVGPVVPDPWAPS